MTEVSPAANTDSKTKFYKKWWFWAIVVIVLIAASAGASEESPNTNVEKDPALQSSEQKTSAAVEPKKEEPKIPAEYKSALSQANTYANQMHLSKQGVYDQLVSEYGGKFTAEAAQYAIENVKADWNANAVAQAKTYQNDLHLSPAAVRDQLTSQYGAKFTPAEADYGVQHMND